MKVRRQHGHYIVRRDTVAREALRLRLKGLAYVDIAKALGVSNLTARVLVRRAEKMNDERSIPA